MRGTSIELSRQLQELGAWKGRTVCNEDRHWIVQWDMPLITVFMPTLSDLLDALEERRYRGCCPGGPPLAHTGRSRHYVSLWRMIDGTYHAAVSHHGRLPTVDGAGSSWEDALASCLVAVLEAEADRQEGGIG